MEGPPKEGLVPPTHTRPSNSAPNRTAPPRHVRRKNTAVRAAVAFRTKPPTKKYGSSLLKTMELKIRK